MLGFSLAFLPSFLHVFIRKALGQKIGSNVKIKIGSVIRCKNLTIDDGVRIGPFCYLYAEKIVIKKSSSIKSFSVVSAKIVEIGQYVQIAPISIISGDRTPRSKIIIGDHSRIFPFCWLDSGEGISIGNNVGIGGHTLIFTHGVWSNYLEGGPVSFGSVVIEDDVWLPWRVFIMPGVVIGKKSIIGANSLVNKSIQPNSLAAGSPAKIIKENFLKLPTTEEQISLAQDIFKEYAINNEGKNILYKDGKVFMQNGIISLDISDIQRNNIVLLLEKNDMFEAEDISSFKGCNIIYHPKKIAFIRKDNKDAIDFIVFLRRYGIRLVIENSI